VGKVKLTSWEELSGKKEKTARQ